MSETPSQPTPVMPAEQTGAEHPTDSAAIGPARRKGRARRIALIAVALRKRKISNRYIFALDLQV